MTRLRQARDVTTLAERLIRESRREAPSHVSAYWTGREGSDVRDVGVASLWGWSLRGWGEAGALSLPS
jgi:hypothetical protein